MKKLKRTRKYFTPQTQNAAHICDHEGCTQKGEYRAPKDRNLKDYYWFCLDHVQEYNAKWNYYSGISDQEPEEEVKPEPKFRFKSNVKYKSGFKFKDDLGFGAEYFPDFEAMNEVYYNDQERKYLKIMELGSEKLDIKTLKQQYKKLAKKYHPDTNLGDKDMEEKFKQLNVAYQALLCKLS